MRALRPFAWLFVGAWISALQGTPANALNLTIACMDVGRAVEACEAEAGRFAEASGHSVRVVLAEAAGRTSLERYQALFEVESGRVDVVQFPVAWFHALADDLAPIEATFDTDGLLEAVAEVGRVGDLYLALPQHIAITLVYKRNDVIAGQPEVWGDLRDTLLQAASDSPTGLSVAGAGTALFPFFLDWTFSFGATSLEDRERIAIALEAMDEGLGAVASRDIAEVNAEAAVDDFISGNSAVLLARSTRLDELIVSPVGELISTSARPRDAEADRPTPLLASAWLIGVSRHSRNPLAAAELANAIAAPDAQRRAALDYGLSPAFEALYDEADVRAASPANAVIANRIGMLRGVPIEDYGPAYLELADEVSESVRAMIRGELDASQATRAIVQDALRARRQRQ